MTERKDEAVDPSVPLRLFVLGRSRLMRRAIANARALGTVEVVDIGEYPEKAEADRILATPTLIRADSLPARIVGDLNDLEAVRYHLGLPFAEDDEESLEDR